MSRKTAESSGTTIGHGHGHGNEQRQPQRTHNEDLQHVDHRVGDQGPQQDLGDQLGGRVAEEDHEHLHGEHHGERGHPAGPAGIQARIHDHAQDDGRSGGEEHAAEQMPVAIDARAGEARLFAFQVGGDEAGNDHEDGRWHRCDERGFGEIGEEPHDFVEYRSLHASCEHGVEVVDVGVSHQHRLKGAHACEQQDGDDEHAEERRQDLFPRSALRCVDHDDPLSWFLVRAARRGLAAQNGAPASPGGMQVVPRKKMTYPIIGKTRRSRHRPKARYLRECSVSVLRYARPDVLLDDKSYFRPMAGGSPRVYTASQCQGRQRNGASVRRVR